MTRSRIQELEPNARRLWAEGKNLGEIATELGCSIYDLSPWLYRDELREAMAEAERRYTDGADSGWGKHMICSRVLLDQPAVVDLSVAREKRTNA